MPTTHQECQNCSAILPPQARYCPGCGQKYHAGVPTFRAFLAEGFSDFFNVDSRFWRTARDLFVPGKMTRAWFEGKRRRYLPPLRITVVIALALVTASLYMIGTSDFLDIRDSRESHIAQTAYHDDLIDMDTLTQNLRTLDEHPKFAAALDSVRTRLGISDALYEEVDYVDLPKVNGWNVEQGRDRGYHIPSDEIYSEIPIDSLLRKYQVEGFWNRLVVQQTIRLNRTGDDFGAYLLTSGAWTVLLLIPLTGLLFRLLYIRRDYHYLHHVVFLLHLNAALIVAFIGMVLFGHFHPGWIIGGGFVVLAIFTYVSMLRVYRQHWFKTFVKYVLASVIYLAFLLPMASVGVLALRVAFY